MELKIYTDLKAHIEKHIPEIKTVRLFNNQFNREGVESSFQYPTCMIQIQTNDIRTMGLGIQQVEFLITTHLGFNSYLDEDVYILKLKQDLYKCVERFQANDTVSMFNRVAQRENYDHDNVQVFETDYMVTAKDYTADIRSNKKVTLTPVVNPKLIKPKN